LPLLHAGIKPVRSGQGLDAKTCNKQIDLLLNVIRLKRQGIQLCLLNHKIEEKTGDFYQRNVTQEGEFHRKEFRMFWVSPEMSICLFRMNISHPRESHILCFYQTFTLASNITAPVALN
jgi:hypothetical protein